MSMTFGEKLKSRRLTLNLSQFELAEKTGITERSIYNYEQTGAFPKMAVLRNLAEALNVTVNYLLDDDGSDNNVDVDQKLFLAKAKESFGYKGVREAREIVSRAAALFAGGELDNEAKDDFFQSLMEVYFESKIEAREKFSGKRRVSRRKQPQ